MRTCLFCDEKAKTLEHAWPAWLNESLGVSSPSRIEAWLGPEAERKEWHDAPIQIRAVCASCNNGWMSRLEGKARPLIGAMVNDVSITLDQPSQHLVAAWCMKTAMVFESTKPNKSNHFYTHAERQHLRLALALPDGSALWIGRQHRSNFTYCEARRLLRTRPEDEPVFGEGYVTTLAAARLVLQAITVRVNPEYRKRARRIILDRKTGPWDGQGLIRVWPTSALVSWPPAWSFGEPDLDPFSERFRNAP